MEHGAALYTAGIKPWDSLRLSALCQLSYILSPYQMFILSRPHSSPSIF